MCVGRTKPPLLLSSGGLGRVLGLYTRSLICLLSFNLSRTKEAGLHKRSNLNCDHM